MILRKCNIKAIKENLLASPTSEVTSFLEWFKKSDLRMEFLLWGARVPKMYSIQLAERRRNDLRCRQCTTRRMERLDQESKSTETMFGQSLRPSIDSDMLKRKCPEELLCRCILRELGVFSLRQ